MFPTKTREWYCIWVCFNFLMMMYKKGNYRITNKLLLNLIYMYAHFIELTRSPNDIFELDVIFYNVTQEYAIVTRRTSSCSFFFSHYYQTSFILVINFLFFFSVSSHPYSIFSSFCYIFPCCINLQIKHGILVYACYFNSTEKP